MDDMTKKSRIPSGKKLIVANWKMNPSSLKEAKKIFSDVKKGLRGRSRKEIVFAPPFPFLYPLSQLSLRSKVKLAAQDLFWESEGSFTGEVSAAQIKEAGASYAIVGHSERRAMGEGNEEVSKKALAGAKAGLRVIICVGEDKRDSAGNYLGELAKEIKGSLSGISGGRVSNIVVAYEPRWAIGKSAADAIDADELHAASIFIRKTLTSMYGRKKALGIPVIYGGSVEPGNVRSLSCEGMDGFLVGHASLKASQFLKIISGA